MNSLPSTSTVRHFSRLPDRPPPSKWTHLTLAGAQFYCPLSQRPSRWPIYTFSRQKSVPPSFSLVLTARTLPHKIV
jgi:hypothetical protein